MTDARWADLRSTVGDALTGAVWCARHRDLHRGSCEWCDAERARDLALLTRALTAQAWAVACALVGEMHRRQQDEADGLSVRGWSEAALGLTTAGLKLAALPAPADLAAIYFKDGQ